MKTRRDSSVAIKLDMTPMIDCTFLLLVFFMVSSTLHRQEADISFALPGVAEQSEPVEIPDEQILEIRDDGAVVLNDLQYDSPDSTDLPELIAMLIRFRETAAANQVEAMLTIAPGPRVKQQRVVDVLNACSSANIRNVTFATEDDA